MGKSSEYKAAERQNREIANQQFQQSQQQIAAANQRFARADEYQAPLVAFYKAITSGDPIATQKALSVPMSQLDRSFQGTKENIFTQMGEGPGRDLALFQTFRDRNAQKAGLQSQAFNTALTGLADLGTGQSSFGLQQLGAGSNFGQSAVGTNNTNMQQENQRRAALFSAIGQAAGMAGGLLTGGLTSMGGGGGGAASIPWRPANSVPLNQMFQLPKSF